MRIAARAGALSFLPVPVTRKPPTSLYSQNVAECAAMSWPIENRPRRGYGGTDTRGRVG